jgi:hypothetical protein
MDGRRVVNTRSEPQKGVVFKSRICLRSCKLQSALQQSRLLSRPLRGTFDRFDSG